MWVGGAEIPNAVMRRLLAAEARVPLHRMTEGTLSADDWGRLSRRMGEVADAPLMLVQPESLDSASVVQCLDAVRPLNVPAIRLLIVDALPADGRQPATLLALRELARSRQLSVVVVVEEDVQRSDAQLRRIEQIADVVLRIHRHDQTEPDSPRAGEADFKVSRHRLGPQATIVVAFQGHYGRFVDLTG